MGKLRDLDGKGKEIVSIFQERENKGLEKGEARAKIKIAFNMLKDGLSVELVAKYAELPAEKVEGLRKII